MTPREALEQLYAALASVSGVQVSRGVGAPLAPPAVAVGPPRLTRDVYDVAPTEATFQVGVVVAKSVYAMDELLDLEPVVAAALHDLTGAAVGDSVPGTWGGTDLPAYLIDVVFPL